MYYTFELLMINQWSDVANIRCDGESNHTNLHSNFDTRNSQSMAAMPIHCISNGKMVLEMFNFNEDNFLRDIGMLLLLSSIMATFSLIFLKRKSSKRQ